jgi:plasmid stabilization system protein ParE
VSYLQIIRPEAESDMEEGFQWYEERRDGLGLEFLGEIKTVLEKITENPLRHPEIYRSARRSLVRRFPFAVIYIFEFSKVEVIAVTHVKRQPVFWQGRVR